MEHYVYMYLRDDFTPYYVGKGKGRRATNPHSVAVPPTDRIYYVAQGLTEEAAFALEQSMILKYGRKDLGTGILRNLTNGGEGSVPGPETRAKLSAAKIGKRPNNYGKTFKCKTGFENRSRAKSGENHPYYGKARTDEEREKISASIKANWDRPLLTCPHCGKQGKVGMTRWHFDKCKHRSG